MARWAMMIPLLGGCFDAPDPPMPDASVAAASPCAPIATDCTPAYEPSYANVFSITLQPSCAKSGVSCHAGARTQGGIGFYDPDVAYRDLLETTGAVRPGDASCSRLAQRLVATDPTFRMPPGKALPDDEMCAIVQWIRNGAQR